jgi:hypothetical protein
MIPENGMGLQLTAEIGNFDEHSSTIYEIILQAEHSWRI